MATPTAGAHGTLTPASAPAGSIQEFELTVPNERSDADVVAVALYLPDGARLESAAGEQPLWAVTPGENAVTWSGGPVDRGNAQTFSFTAELPSEPGPVEFTLVESYDDGDAAPFPIPVFVTESESGGGGSSSSLAIVALAALAVALRMPKPPPTQ